MHEGGSNGAGSMRCNFDATDGARQATRKRNEAAGSSCRTGPHACVPRDRQSDSQTARRPCHGGRQRVAHARVPTAGWVLKGPGNRTAASSCRRRGGRTGAQHERAGMTDSQTAVAVRCSDAVTGQRGIRGSGAVFDGTPDAPPISVNGGRIMKSFNASGLAAVDSPAQAARNNMNA